MNTDKLKIRWKELIAKDDLDNLFKELHYRILNNSPLYDNFILISSQYNNLIRQHELGIISQSDATLMRNKINNVILKLVSELQNEDLKENRSDLDSTLFGKEWELEDYYRWINRKLNFHKEAFIQTKSENSENNIRALKYSCYTSIITAEFVSRYYDFDTFLIKRKDYVIEFDDPEIGYDKFNFITSTDPVICDETDQTVLIPLDIVSKVEFVDHDGDSGFELIYPKTLFLLRIFTKGKHICFAGGPFSTNTDLFENTVLSDVVALVFSDKELCLNVMNVIQYILNKRDSYPFDETSGHPIMPHN